MKHKRALLFGIPAVLLALLLCWSAVQILRITLPRQREEKAFAALKDSVRRPAASGEARPPETPPPETGGASRGSPPVSADDPAAETAEAGTEPAPPETEYRYELLRQQNPDFVGWLTIADTPIDYPVMKSSEADPQYYLRRDFYGETSSLGCLFVGGGCGPESLSFIIYGHNINSDAMFGSLDAYADEDFARSHREILLAAPDGERVYRVFAAFRTRLSGESEGGFRYDAQIGELTQAEYEQAVEALRALSGPSLPDVPRYPEQLLLLSTCSYHTDNGRFVVAAYRVQ